jgi:arabinogalactan endo-1,4-beta-galactosidase
MIFIHANDIPKPKELLYLCLKPLIMRLALLILWIALFAACKTEPNKPFLPPEQPLEIRGADVSNLMQGQIYIEDNFGSIGNMMSSLSSNGVNMFRFRVWHNSPLTNLDSINQLMSDFTNFQTTKSYLTLHYSDTWADPGHQAKPAAWANLSFELLKDSVYAYTKAVVLATQPDFISIGNEINPGLLLPSGSSSNPTQMKALLEVGIQAVNDANPSTKIILHVAGYEQAPWFFNLVSDLDYDIMGISYYPRWHGKDLSILQEKMELLTTTHEKDIMIVETSYPFTFDWCDNTNNVIGLGEQIIPEYAPTKQGQLEYMLAIKNVCQNVPRCLGFCYWGSEMICNTPAGSGSPWENQALFDFDTVPVPAMKAFEL